jgi:hypothetical protein
MTKKIQKRTIAGIDWTVTDDETGRTRMIDRKTKATLAITDWVLGGYEVEYDIKKKKSSVRISCDGKTESSAIREFERVMAKLRGV